MKVSYDEDLANHIGPESCVYGRKAVGEALTGGSAGRVLSRERGIAPGCRRRQRARKATRDMSISQEVFWPRVVGDPAHARKLSAREPGGPAFGRGGWRHGPRCESQGSTTATNRRRKSDLCRLVLGSDHDNHLRLQDIVQKLVCKTGLRMRFLILETGF